jgi:hypothetical protein
MSYVGNAIQADLNDQLSAAETLDISDMPYLIDLDN